MYLLIYCSLHICDGCSNMSLCCDHASCMLQVSWKVQDQRHTSGHVTGGKVPRSKVKAINQTQSDTRCTGELYLITLIMP